MQSIEVQIQEINMPTLDDLASVVQRLETDIEQCLELLGERLQVVSTATGTHQLLTITGVDRSPECLRDLAVYCVGQIAKAVQVNLEIRADLLGVDDDARVQLIRDVYSVIGESNDDLTDTQKEYERDPWLFEALSHLFVHLSTKKEDFFPIGTPIGLTMTHRGVKEQGLDLVAIYASTDVGLSIGESKAWEDDPSGGLRDAVEKKFREVDLGNYDAELRTIVGQMRYAMPAEYQGKITGAFWRNERAYLPFIGYDSKHNPRWTSNREALKTLDIPATHRVLFPLPIEGFRDFFEDLSDAMRAYLALLEKR